MAEQIQEEAKNKEMRRDVDALVDKWPGVKYIHETGKSPDVPGAYRSAKITFPQPTNKHKEIREYLRDTRQIEEVLNADGKPTGFIVLGRKV
jgi:hypothetical protein